MASYLVPRAPYPVPRTSYLVLRTSYLVPRTSPPHDAADPDGGCHRGDRRFARACARHRLPRRLRHALRRPRQRAAPPVWLRWTRAAREGSGDPHPAYWYLSRRIEPKALGEARRPSVAGSMAKLPTQGATKGTTRFSRFLEAVSSRLTTHYSLRLTTYGLRLTTYDLRLTTYDSRLTTYDSRLTTYDLRLTT